MLAYIRFTTPPKTRTDRAEAARGDGLASADEKMRAFLLGVLQAYEALGETELATGKLGDFLTARYGSLADAKAALGDVSDIRQAKAYPFSSGEHDMLCPTYRRTWCGFQL